MRALILAAAALLSGCALIPRCPAPRLSPEALGGGFRLIEPGCAPAPEEAP